MNNMIKLPMKMLSKFMEKYLEKGKFSLEDVCKIWGIQYLEDDQDRLSRSDECVIYPTQ